MATKPALAVDNTRAPRVYAAINGVMKAMAKEGIAKGRRNQQQGYQFRGIDDVYNALCTALADNALVMLPRVIAYSKAERETQRGGALFYTTAEVEFDLVSAEDGSSHTVRTLGEAMDSADKSSNKAMSAAYKYAAMQAFCIPTEGDNDADAITHEVKAQPRQSAREGLSADVPWPEDFDTYRDELREITSKADLTAWCNRTAGARAAWPKTANERMRGLVVEQQNYIKSLDSDPTRAG